MSQLDTLQADIEDLLVCGSCQKNFPLGNIVNFVQHKKFDCNEFTSDLLQKLVCQSCPRRFETPWSLLMHAQNVHALKIFLERGSSVELSTVELSTEVSKISHHRRKEISELCINAEKDNSRLQLDKENCFSRPIADLNPALKSFNIPTKSSGRLPTIVNITSKLGSLINNGGLDACAPIYTSSKLDEVERVGGLPEVGRKIIEMVDVGTQADPVKKRIDTEGGNSEVFLSNEEEASTSVPRTLKKCCSSIVPKKRKRHMETKHMPMGSAKRRLSSSEPTNIFIDLEPHEDYMVADCSQQYGDDAYGDSQGDSRGDFEVKTEDSINRPSHSRGMKKSRSVIIQPGTTFSIPVSYALGMTPTFEISSFNSSRWMSPTASSLLQPQKVLQELPTAKSSSFVIFKEDPSNASVSSGYPTPAVSSEQQFESSPGEKYDFYQASDQFASVSFEREERGEDGQYQKKRRYPTSRPFKCDQCTNSFNQRIHLKKHQSKHTGVKPFKCDRCDYSTVERSHLKVHIRVHTGEKPYKCTYCEYATAQNSTLKIHLKRHHLSNDGRASQFSCSACGLHFQHEDSFSNHAFTEHHQLNLDGISISTTSASGVSPEDAKVSDPPPEETDEANDV